MKQLLKIIITIIGLISIFSCSFHEKKISGVVIFESGKMRDSVINFMDYYTYSQDIDKNGTKHIYELDSIYSRKDSIFIKSEQDYDKHNKKVYFQSQDKDTLYLKYYENDTVLTFSEYYELLDSVKINISNEDFMIFKYELPMPPCDGDLTVFFNNDMGLIEEYNRGWGARSSIMKHPFYNNQISTIISKLRSLGKFYYFVIPPPPPPPQTENKINNKSFY